MTEDRAADAAHSEAPHSGRDVVVGVELAGVFDRRTAGPLRRYLTFLAESVGRAKFVFDLVEVSRLDAAVLQVIAAAARRVISDGGSAAMVRPAPAIWAMFEDTGLAAMFDLVQCACAPPL